MGLWSSSLHGYQMFLRKKEKKKRKRIKPPAVQKKTQSASGPHIKACCFNHHYSKIFSLHLSWASSLVEIAVICGRTVFTFTAPWTLMQKCFLSKSLIGHASKGCCWVVGWVPGGGFRDSSVYKNARTDKKKRGNAMWELNVVSDSKNSSKYLQWGRVHCLSFEYLLVFYFCLGFGLLIYFFYDMLQTEQRLTGFSFTYHPDQ